MRWPQAANEVALVPVFEPDRLREPTDLGRGASLAVALLTWPEGAARAEEKLVDACHIRS